MYIGQSLKRREDRRLLTGRGRYVDDLAPAGAAHVVFVRSPHAHALIEAIATARAAAMPGVLAVLTGADATRHGLGRIPCIFPVAGADGRVINHALRPVLALGVARHVGEPVAAVVAETRAQALDAADSVEPRYRPLDAVIDIDAAASGAPALVHEAFGGNLAFEVHHGRQDLTEAAFGVAHHVCELVLTNNKVTANPMEPRTCVGAFETAGEQYTLVTSTQLPHLLRSFLAEDVLQVPEHKVRVVAPDVGGGFGMKCAMYPEEALVLWAARLIGRPVRWAATRCEGLQSDAHARHHSTRARMGFAADGRIVGLAVDTIADLGAYCSTFGPGIPANAYGLMMSGSYAIPAIHVRIRGVYTNTVPVEAYRGAARPEAAYVVERLIETGARELGLDACDLRARNFIRPEQYPYTTATNMTYDSADHPRLLHMLKARVDYDGLRREQRRRRDAEHCVGIGVASFIDYGGGPSQRFARKVIGRRMGSFETGAVRVHPSGKVTIFAGTQNHGQGHETTFSQIVADRLGCPIDDVELVSGDTGMVGAGLGTWGSRSLVMAGSALNEAAETIARKCAQLAAHLLDADEDALERTADGYALRGSNRGLSFKEVCRAAYHGASFPPGFRLGLDEMAFYEPPNWVFSTGIHLAVVSVDTETGRVALEQFHAIDDAGRLVNPMIVEGQVHGGIAQGLGQALMEECVYDPDSGQLLSGSFMDYAMPRAADLPSFRTATIETRAASNALGVKGAGESGTIGAPCALVNAVVDALSPWGVRHVDMPLTPAKIWSVLQGARR